MDKYEALREWINEDIICFEDEVDVSPEFLTVIETLNMVLEHMDAMDNKQ